MPIAEFDRASGLLRAILDNLPVVVGRLDSDGRVTDAEGDGLAPRGLSSGKLVGRALADFYPPARGAVERALGGGSADFSIRRGDGREVWEVEFHLSADAENPGGAVFFGLDITARRRLERRLLSISDEEQRRIGADLHDGLGQHLTGTACLAAALRDQLHGAHPAEAAQADRIVGLVNAAIDLTRLHARGLCPVPVEQSGLHDALADLASQVRRLHGVECHFENGGPPLAVAPDVALQLYRIAQEAIANAIRHGAADRIVVKLQTSAKPSSLVIEDNGHGFDPSARPGGGIGLHLMEHRAAYIGADFRIAPHPRGGMRVECVLGRERTDEN
jgi:PAS domain S-box-containing protein